MDTKLSTMFDKFQRFEIRGANKSTNTDESYANAKKLCIRFFGDISISNLNEINTREFYEHLTTWQKPNTVRLNIVCLRCVIKYASRKGIQVMDVEDLRVPQRQKTQIVYLDDQEMAAFIAAAGQKRPGYRQENRLRNVAMIKLLFATGIRPGELCRLNRNSIRNRQFSVIGKSKDPRPAYITKDVEDAIREYLSVRTDRDLALFTSPSTGRRISVGTIQEVYRRVRARSGLYGTTARVSRHSFATKLLRGEVDIFYISDFLGHQSLDTTKLYLHYENPKLRHVYEVAMGS